MQQKSTKVHDEDPGLIVVDSRNWCNFEPIQRVGKLGGSQGAENSVVSIISNLSYKNLISNSISLDLICLA